MTLKYTLKTKRIEIDGPDNYVEVRGLSVNHIVQLMTINRPAIDELFSQFAGRDEGSINEAEVMNAGMGMVENAPAMVAHIIALAANATEQFDQIVDLPIGVQVASLEAIGELTFAAGGGPKKMLALAMKLVGNQQSKNPSP